MLDQLMQPIDYLRIRHPKKWVVDWLSPTLITGMFCFLMYLIEPINRFGQSGVIQSFTQFIQTLPGFYIASLAVVVTLNRPGMDELILSPTPYISEKLRGKENEIPLTRRRFLAMLFAFLTVESLISVFMGILGPLIAGPVAKLTTSNLQILLGEVFMACFFFLVFQMTICTLWGLHYLGTRAHQP